jgi:MraZ protein
VGSSGNISMFCGRYDRELDDKGRVSLPGPFRDELQARKFDRVYIANSKIENERFLEVYPPDEWERLVANLKRKGTFDINLQLFQVFFIGGTHEVQVDRQGRILVPSKLREFAGLGHEVAFSGMPDYFQLWDRRALDRTIKFAEERVGDRSFRNSLGL